VKISLKAQYQADPTQKRERVAKYREANSALVSAAKSMSYSRKREMYLARNARYYAANREQVLDTNAVWKKSNPHKVIAYNVKRRAQVLNATPPWADHARIAEVYALAALFQQKTGIEFHVDHIWPLKGENFCGLHIHQNLRPISKAENLEKGNARPHYANC
jgi:hypothetical protein